MTENIVTKQCITCNQIKPISDFRKQRRSCRKCSNRKQNAKKLTDKHREYEREYRKRPSQIITKRNYENSEKCLEYRRKYRASERFKEIQRNFQRNRRARYKKEMAAHAEILRLINAGLLSPPSSYHCRICWSIAENYHHHRGYDKKNVLDITPVCVKCHAKIHRRYDDNGKKIV